MLTLMFLVFIVSVTGAMRRAAAPPARAGAARHPGAAGRTVGPYGPSPFAAAPFGSLLEQLMQGGGGWTRAIEYDPHSGEWVELTDTAPEPQPNADRPPSQPPPGEGRAPRRRLSSRAAPATRSRRC